MNANKTAHTDSKIVLLFGPHITYDPNSKSYGGGIGGYTRSMSIYLQYYRDKVFKIYPCFYTSRKQLKFDKFWFRFLVDSKSLFNSIITSRPKIIHILAQYRTAIFREAFSVLMAKLFNIPIVYEIRAGVFESWYKNTNFLSRLMTKICIKNSDIILAEGQPYLDFIKNEFNKEAHYHPNILPTSEISSTPNNILSQKTLRILFVGYLYRDKGVLEAVQACINASKEFKIELTLVGKEHPEINELLNNIPTSENLKINRLGALPHENVLEQFSLADIYLYPTYHGGEGHNNSINEAMMHGLLIITTKKGFLGHILNDDTAIFVKEQNVDDIIKAIRFVNFNIERSKEMAVNARNHLLENYTSESAFKNLTMLYKSIT